MTGMPSAQPLSPETAAGPLGPTVIVREPMTPPVTRTVHGDWFRRAVTAAMPMAVE